MQPPVRVTALVAVVLAVGFVAWLVLRDGDDASERAGTGAPRVVTVEELAALAADEGPLYWAGARDGVTYELSRRPDGGVFVRYLPEGAEVGDRAGYLTVATYPLRDPVAAIERAGRAEGATVTKLDGGGRAVTNRRRPTNAYFAFPGAPVQVEVYDPKAGRAAELVRSGRVVPVEPR